MNLRPLFMSCFALMCASSLLLSSCEQANTSNTPAALGADSNSVSSSGTVKLEGQIISIPSPNQLASLMRQSNIPFKAEMLHNLGKRESYLSEQKKAMNLGVYGTDLAYIANFEKAQLANDYFDVVGKLAGELEVLDHIDSRLVNRLSSNISQRDSVLRLSSQFFQSADRYLKNNERSDLAGLILLGGWVESVYLACEPAVSNEEIKKRIGEQKHACASLLNLVNNFQDPSMDQLKKDMKALNDVYSELETSYAYQKPITDAKEKKTYFTSKTSVTVSPEQLQELTNRIQAIRAIIIQ